MAILSGIGQDLQSRDVVNDLALTTLKHMPPLCIMQAFKQFLALLLLKTSILDLLISLMLSLMGILMLRCTWSNLKALFKVNTIMFANWQIASFAADQNKTPPRKWLPPTPSYVRGRGFAGDLNTSDYNYQKSFMTKPKSNN